MECRYKGPLFIVPVIFETTYVVIGNMFPFLV